MQMDRKEDWSDLDLTGDEINELEGLLRMVEQELGEADPPMPDSLKSEALLPLLDGVEQEEPAPEEPSAEPEPRRQGRLIFGLFPTKYLTANTNIKYRPIKISFTLLRTLFFII